MKILHVFDHSIPLQSGYTFRSRAILLEQRQKGWETVQVTGAKQGVTGAAFEVIDGLEFYRTPVSAAALAKFPGGREAMLIRDLKLRVLEVAEETKPDILHAHSPVLNGLAALQAGAKLGLPVVYEIRAFWEDAAVDHGTSAEWGLRYRLTRALETYVVKRVGAVCTICDGLKGDLVRRGIGPDKITIIPNAVNIERFPFEPVKDSALIESLGLSDKFVLGFIGSFYAYEGIEILIAALPAVRERLDNLHVLLVGGGPRWEAVAAQVEHSGLGDIVSLTGRVPHEEVERYYSIVDAFCYPRSRMRLTDLVTPLKPLEAMAQGKIVIASNVGGHRELIEPGVTGVLFSADDAVSMADAIITTVRSPEQWPAMRKAAREYVEEMRNWSASVNRYSGVYRNILNNHTAQSENCVSDA